MLNGAFGVGKTATARLLAEVIPNSAIYDPAEVGQMVRRITQGIRYREENTDDFQDIAIWRRLVVTTAEALFERYSRIWVVPMTLPEPEHLEEVRTGLTLLDANLFHFTLTASQDTINQRLLQRGDNEYSWAWRKSSRLAELFTSAMYAEHIDTEGKSISEVAAEVVARLPL
jgi:hypothetical protein